MTLEKSKRKKFARAECPPSQRRITLYLPTKNIVNDIHKEAEKAGMTTSHFVQELVKSYIESGDYVKSQKVRDKRVEDLEEQNRQLRGENIELSKKVKMLNTYSDRLETENISLRNKPFLNDSFEGIREFDSRLIELLKEKKNVKEHELFDLLHIKLGDSETIKALNRQLDILFEYNLVKKYKGGLQWLG